jgi:Effector-associated domain 11/CHAT domain
MDKITEQEIQNLIGADKLDAALDKFIKWATATNSDLKNPLLLQKGKYSTLKKQEGLNLIDYKDASMTRSQVVNSVLGYLEEAAASTPTATVTPPQPQPQPTFVPPQPQPQVQTQTTIIAKTQETVTASNVILFLAANPWDTARLQLEKEFTKVFNNLQNSKFVVKSEFAVTPSSLQKAILKYKPRVIHFSGHGLTDNDISTIQNTEDRGVAFKAKGGAGIVLQDDKGRAKIMETKNLVAMFQTFQKFKIPIDTVIFNSCHSRTQAEGIRNYVNYVVGYSNAIKDDAAIVIANEFYSYYAENDNVELAYELTKNIVSVEGYSEDQLMALLKKDGL